jgi:hypothetical protein
LSSDEKILNPSLVYLLESLVMKEHKILFRKFDIILWGGIDNSGRLSHKYLTFKGLTLAVFGGQQLVLCSNATEPTESIA